MALDTKTILGIRITTSPKQDILDAIEKQKRPPTIVTPNPEQIVLAQKDKHFAKLLNQADVAIPDGIGLAIALGIPRIAGVEFMEDVVGIAVKKRMPVAFIGGRGGVAVAALECLKQKYPGLTGWAMEPEDGDVLEKLRVSAPHFIFVGLGAPKQEFFIEQLRMSLRAKRSNLYQNEIATSSRALGTPRNDGVVFMSVGGSFDIIAGRLPRAPFLLRTIGVEWLWRLVRQPWRFRRQLALLKFLWLLAVKG